jgi:predicted dehydrogenase
MSIGFAVVGMGMGWARCRDLVKTPGTDLKCVVDLDAEKARRAGEELGCDHYGSLEPALGRKDVSCVMIMTPSGTHLEIAEQVARAGKHVLTTKPMEVTADKCLRMIAAAKRHGVKLAVDYEFRYDARLRQAKWALEQGMLGRPMMCEVRCKWFRGQEYYDQGGWRGTWKMDGGGALANQGSHLLDIILWLMGPPKAVSAEVCTLNHKIETEDTGAAMVEFKNGSRGLIQSTTTFPENTFFGVELHGTEGAFIIPSLTSPSRDDSYLLLKDAKKREAILSIKSDLPNGMADMARYIEKGIPPMAGAAEGLAAVRFLSEIYDAARKGSRVQCG